MPQVKAETAGEVDVPFQHLEVFQEVDGDTEPRVAVLRGEVVKFAGRGCAAEFHRRGPEPILRRRSMYPIAQGEGRREYVSEVVLPEVAARPQREQQVGI